MTETQDLLMMFKTMIESVEQLRKTYTAATYGPSTEGYLWEGVFLPNGTMLQLKSHRHCFALAAISFGELRQNGEACSFEELEARAQDNASNTSMTLSILRPDDWEWVEATELKAQRPKGRIYRSNKPHFKP